MTDRRSLVIDGVRVTYTTTGDGPTIVLVHSGGTHTSWQTWSANAETLARHFRVLVPDLPGLGDSEAPPVPIASEDDFFHYHPRFIRAFLNAVSPQGAILIGAGAAGGVCLTVAARYPEICHALVLVDAEVIGRIIETETSLLRCPTLIVWQQDDMLVPPQHALTLADRIPGAELRVFPGDHARDEWGGNMPHRLWPAEFDATVLDFLDRVTATVARHR
jgi:pimeloyl-ACP methyl ester carboxylesterase